MAYFFDEDENSPGHKKPQRGLEYPAQKKEYDQFKLRLHEEILRSQRRKYPFTLMRVEIDPSKSAPLGIVEEVLKSTIREYDVLCSINKESYVIAFPETGESYAEQIASRIKQSVEEKSWADAVTETYQANIGIACFPQDGATAEDLLTSAENDLSLSRKKLKE